MATHAAIGYIREDNNTVDYIYVHSDGNLAHTGVTLLHNYNTKERVKALIELGNISVLHDYLYPSENEEHDFDHRAENVTVAYHRDRGDKLRIHAIQADILAKTYDTDKNTAVIKELCLSCDTSHVYLYKASSGIWFATDETIPGIKIKKLKTLVDALC